MFIEEKELNQYFNYQIVTLQNDHKILYSEVIDTIESRSMLWVRPILMVEKDQNNNSFFEPQSSVYDLRFTSDILWNASGFLPALDTEYITFFCQIQNTDYSDYQCQIARQKLSLFLKEIFKTEKD